MILYGIWAFIFIGRAKTEKEGDLPFTVPLPKCLKLLGWGKAKASH